MKVKVNKTPLIILLCLAAAFAIAAVLTFVLPQILPKPDCPIQVTEKIKMVYDSHYQEYTLVGEIKNVSDEKIVIKNNGGMVVKLSNSENNFVNGWYNDYSDIVLESQDTYDFENCRWALGGGTYAPGVTQVQVTIDGVTYDLVSESPMILVAVFGIFAVVFIICALGAHKSQKDIAKRKTMLVDACASIDEDCVLLDGIISNKDASKKAAAKSAVSVIGGVFSSIFLGFGAYKVYSGSTRKEFVLGKHGLYTFDSSSKEVTTNGLVKLSKENLPAKAVYAKKTTANIESEDGKTTVALFLKKSPVTVEQAVETLNKIFVIGEAPEAAEVTADDVANDPFIDDESVSAPVEKEIAAADDTTAETEEISANDDTNEE